MRRAVTFIAAFAAIAGAFSLAGCNRGTRIETPVAGLEIAPEFGPTVEVTNFRGSVLVIADSRARSPEVQTRVRALERRSGLNSAELAELVHVTADSGVENGRRILKIETTPAIEGPDQVEVELVVRVNRTEAVRVRNAGGTVELVGVSGPISVVNGFGGAHGGDVTVRTGAAMTDPVSLSTTRGNVLYQVGPGSTGTLELNADQGQAQLYIKAGTLTGARPEGGNRYRAVLNGGSNPVLLHTGNGIARVAVLENAATYGPEQWDGTPRWPEYPKPIGRLGGYHNDEPLFRRRAAPPAQ